MRLPSGPIPRQKLSRAFLSASFSGGVMKRGRSNGNSLSQRLPYQAMRRNSSSSASTPIIVVLIVVIGLIIAAMALCYFKRSSIRRKALGKKGSSQASTQNWWNWRSSQTPASYRNTTNEHLEPISESTASNNRARQARQGTTTSESTTATAAQRAAAAAGVDRNTSVRSVMTLPAYRHAPGESEQVLGREGERGGIDVVLEFPETVDELEEQRRDEEMEALYQVRLARRTEAAEREELRRLRREARERNDTVALNELRTRSRAASGGRSTHNLEELRQEHARLRDRQRAVSSVSYADLGVASHDGTRIRANSEESERPLLGDAASMASSQRHRRDRSASSVLSVDSDLPSTSTAAVMVTHSRAGSTATTGETNFRRTSAAPSHSGAMSSPELVDAEHDIGDEEFPPHSPPEYEDIALRDEDPSSSRYEAAPPDYSSPIEAVAPEVRFPKARGEAGTRSSSHGSSGSSRRGMGGTPQLPSLRLGTLPSIVVDTPTPVVGRADES